MRVFRGFSALFLLTVGLLICPRAFAGHWSGPVYSPDPPTASDSGNCGINSSFHVEKTLKAKATWTWERDNPRDIPPRKVNVVERGTVSYQAATQLEMPLPTVDGNLSHGMSDMPQSTNGTPGSQTKKGIRTSQVDSSSGTVVVGATLSASMTVTTGPSTVAAGGVSCAYSAEIKAAHAHPTAFYLVSTSHATNTGVLDFTYKWISDSGDIKDIANCFLTEYTTYNNSPGSTYSPNSATYPNTQTPPNPPYSGPLWPQPNPTAKAPLYGNASNAASNYGNKGQSEGIHDAHEKDALTDQVTGDGPFVNNASQIFKFHCSLCMATGELEVVPGASGPFAIERSVYKQNNTWYYKVSKHGFTSTIQAW